LLTTRQAKSSLSAISEDPTHMKSVRLDRVTRQVLKEAFRRQRPDPSRRRSHHVSRAESRISMMTASRFLPSLDMGLRPLPVQLGFGDVPATAIGQS